MNYLSRAVFRLSLRNVSAKGASFITSLGQTPQDAWTKKTPALKVRLAESRFQRFVTDVIRIPGALPQADVRKAPLALIRYTKGRGEREHGRELLPNERANSRRSSE
jgi:hypothetical protein